MTIARAAPGYAFILSSFLVMLSLSVIIIIDAVMDRLLRGSVSFSVD